MKPLSFSSAIPMAIVYFLGIIILPKICEAQILENQPSEIWIKPSLPLKDMVLTSSPTIGNYFTIDLSQDSTTRKLDELASKQTGSLFIVLRQSLGLDNEPLLSFGPVKLYKDSAIVGSETFPIQIRPDTAAMLRFTYQGRSKRGASSGHFNIAEGLQMAELVFYDKILEPAQARVVESYLGMKYSINITKNDNPELRDYIDIYDNQAWDSKSDKEYDEEVMALGRLDRISFFQPQTFTSDSKSIRFTTDLNSSLGQINPLNCEDKSLVLLSKKTSKIPAPIGECGTVDFTHPWKLRFINWRARASNLYVELDTVYNELTGASLTDGANTWPLEISILQNKTTITIPVADDSLINKVFYISWSSINNNCEPLCTVYEPHCNQGEGKGLFIQVDGSALPATLNLTNSQNGNSISTTLNTQFNTVEGIEEGTYELNIFNERVQLADRVFHAFVCPDEINTGEVEMNLISISAEDFLVSLYGSEYDVNKGSFLSAHSPEILFGNRMVQAYPNPASEGQEITLRFYNQKEESVIIEIFDSSGKLIYSSSFTPHSQDDYMFQTFHTSGLYQIRFTGSEFTYNQPVIIK